MGMRVGSLLLLAAVAALAPTVAHAALYTISASADATINLQDTRQSAGPVEQLNGIIVSAVMDTNTQAWAHAEYGLLRASAYGQVNSPARLSGYSNANAACTDTLTVTGAAPGTAVDLKFSYVVHGSVSSSRQGTPNPLDAWGVGRLQVNSNLGTFDNGFWSNTDQVAYRSGDPLPASDTVTMILHTFTGDTVDVQYSLAAHTFTGSAHDLVGNATFLASADLGNTAYLQIESLTPGASFAAGSGASYATVPEPASVGIVLLTASGLLSRRRH